MSSPNKGDAGRSGALTTRQLKDLAFNSKERTTIYFKPSEDAPFELISSESPLALAKALSDYAAKNVKQKQTIKVARQDLVPSAKGLLTITADTYICEAFQSDDGARVKQVFQWMKDLAKGKKDLLILPG